MIIDGNGLIVGRVSARIAKEMLRGNDVTVVNADKMVFSGNKTHVLWLYKERRSMQDKANPEHNPKWPRRPDLLVRRIIRGMLPWKAARGKQAFKKLKVYMGMPGKLTPDTPEWLDGVSASKLKTTRLFSISDLCAELGWRR